MTKRRGEFNEPTSEFVHDLACTESRKGHLQGKHRNLACRSTATQISQMEPSFADYKMGMHTTVTRGWGGERSIWRMGDTGWSA